MLPLAFSIGIALAVFGVGLMWHRRAKGLPSPRRDLSVPGRGFLWH